MKGMGMFLPGMIFGRKPFAGIHVRHPDAVKMRCSSGQRVLDPRKECRIVATALVLMSRTQSRQTGPSIRSGTKNTIFPILCFGPIDNGCILGHELGASLERICDLVGVGTRIFWHTHIGLCESACRGEKDG